MSDKTFTDWVQEQQKLDPYQDIKSTKLACINYYFIGSYLGKACIFELPDDFEPAQYKLYKQIFTRIVVLFNESYIMDKITSDSLLVLSKIDIDELHAFQSTPYNPDNIYSSLFVSNYSEDSKQFKNV
ncbi:hypothetical protein RF11_08067 [Thelohanellus kitauei]|uniref:Uncharacterized protein n=1 Tax=Thelohanellus kitauei TaxID=669202 RepID=A0A0C2M3H3_THEKT|nr:hypothetical protein RF11_08067 [Thelohanellus kitauei]